MARVLAIDYGMKRTGLAVTDPLKIIANPIGTVNTTDIVSWIQNYFKTEIVDTFVIGLPSRFSGADTHATQPVLSFIEILKNTFPDIPVVTIDERLTSHEAKQAIIASGVRKIKRQDKKLVDTVSAAIILQTYLQSIS